MTSLATQMKRLGRHSTVYGLGGVVSRVLAVFLLPLYTRFLDTADLGAVGLVVAGSAVLVTILGSASRSVLPLLLRLEGARTGGSSCTSFLVHRWQRDGRARRRRPPP